MNTTWIFEKEKEKKKAGEKTGWENELADNSHTRTFHTRSAVTKKSPCNRCCLSLLQVWLSCYLRAKKSREESAKDINSEREREREKIGMGEQCKGADTLFPHVVLQMVSLLVSFLVLFSSSSWFSPLVHYFNTLPWFSLLGGLSYPRERKRGREKRRSRERKLVNENSLTQ